MTANIERKKFWEQQVEKLRVSGLSRSQYCCENSINYDRFSYWVKKLPPASSEFVPVKLQASASTSTSLQATLCTIELRGHILKIHDLSALSFVLERIA